MAPLQEGAEATKAASDLTKAAGTELANADSQGAWDNILSKYKGADKTFGTMFSPDAAKRAGEFTITPEQKQTNQRAQAQLSLETQRLIATGADPALIKKISDPNTPEADRQDAVKKVRDQIVKMKGDEAAAAAMAPINALMNSGVLGGESPASGQSTGTGGINIPAQAPGQPGVTQLAAQNNNPGNLRFAGQQGAKPGAGGYASFPSPEAGYAALQNQIQIDTKKGLTLQQYITKYAPPSENDTAGYIAKAAQAVGVDPKTPLSQIDANKLAQFQVKQESSSTVNGTPAALVNGRNEDILKNVNPGIASQVRAIADGRLPLPPAGQRNPINQAIRMLVSQYEPGYDYTDPQARVKASRDYSAGGNIGQQISAVDTALQHGALLSDLADNLKNTSYPKYNSIANWVAKNTGSPEVTQFLNARQKFAQELTAAWRKNGGDKSDVEENLRALDAANSPEQIHKVMADDVALLQGKYEPLARKYETTMGKPIGQLGLGQKSQDAAKKIVARAGNNGGSVSPIAEPKSKAEYDALPVGTIYIKNGQQFKKK